MSSQNGRIQPPHATAAADGPEWVRHRVKRWASSMRVGQLTAAERGVFHELMVLESISGPWQWDVDRLARMTRLLPAELEAALPVLRDLGLISQTESQTESVCDPPRWSNDTAAAERERAMRTARARSASARQANDRRWHGLEGGSGADPSQTESVCDSATDHKRSRKRNPDGEGRGRKRESARAREAQQQDSAAEPATPALSLDGSAGGAPEPEPDSWLDDARRMLPPTLASLDATWARWLRHLGPDRPTSRTQLETHLAAVQAVSGGAGLEAARGLLEDAISAGVKVIRQDAVRRALGSAGGRPDPTGSDRARAEIADVDRRDVERIASDLEAARGDPPRHWPAYRSWLALLSDRRAAADAVASRLGCTRHDLAAQAVAAYRGARLSPAEQSAYGALVDRLASQLDAEPAKA